MLEEFPLLLNAEESLSSSSMRRSKANSALRLLPAEDDENFVLPLGTEEFFVLRVVVDAEGEDELLDVVEENELVNDFFVSTRRSLVGSSSLSMWRRKANSTL